MITEPPDPIPEPDWMPIDIPAVYWHGRSFVSGDPTGDRLRVTYYLREADERVMARAWFGPGAAGPPGHAHGGSIAAVLDEIMGMGAWVLGHRVLAATVTIRFLKTIPLGAEATVEAWVDQVSGRKVTMKSRLYEPGGGAIYAEAGGLFLTLERGQLEALAKLVPGELDHPRNRRPRNEPGQ